MPASVSGTDTAPRLIPIQEGALSFRPQPHDEVDLGDLVALGGLEALHNADAIRADIANRAGVFEEEMRMVARIRVEDGLAPLDREAANEADLGEEVQDIIHRRQRGRHPGGLRFRGEGVGGQVAITLSKQQLGEAKTLPRRPQPITFQQGTSLKHR